MMNCSLMSKKNEIWRIIIDAMKKLSSFNDYFQNDENVDKMIYQNKSVADVFTDQKSTVLKKFDDEKI